MPYAEILITTIAIFMTIIIGLLVALLRKGAETDVRITMTTELDRAIERIDMAIRHHTDVAAVVEMVRQLDANPDSLELIKSYPETVRAAALLHYTNILGSSLQAAQNRLSAAYNSSSVYKRDFINVAQREVDALRSKLDAAIQASGQNGLRSV